MNIASAAARYCPTESAAITAMHSAISAEIRRSSSAETELWKVLYPASSVTRMAVSRPKMVRKIPSQFGSRTRRRRRRRCNSESVLCSPHPWVTFGTVRDPHRGRPDDLPILLLAAHIVITGLPRGGRVVHPRKLHLGRARLRGIDIGVVSDDVHLSEFRGSN